MALLPSDPQKQKLIMLGVIPVALLALYWYFMYSPRTEKMDQQQARLEQLQTKNTAAKAIAAKAGPDLKKKLALYEEHAARLEQLIPRTEEVPDLLHDITLRSEENGVDLNLMRPDKAAAAGPYTMQVYSMSVYGPYDGIARFLTAVGSLPRIITPVHLKLVPRRERLKTGDGTRLQADFQIETYVAEPPPPPPPVKKGGKAAPPKAGAANAKKK